MGSIKLFSIAFGQKTEPTFKSRRKRAFVASGTENLGRT